MLCNVATTKNPYFNKNCQADDLSLSIFVGDEIDDDDEGKKNR